ncbi:MAG TPA: alpha/beta hydrolase [Acidimicrobiia bacterium]|nr:alpha/beta hydrolase [Acidimicrobiia bacterium]
MTPRGPETHRFETGELELAVHEWGGSGPAILLSHATGFHGVVWRPVAERLIDQGHRVFSFDFRGHGDSDAPDIEYRWEGFGRDVLAVVEHLGLTGDARPFAAGHSKGAAALLMAEAERPGTFRGLWLFEPIMMPIDPPPGPHDDNPLSRGARRRRMVWDSPDEALANYSAKPPLDVLAPAALAAYVEHGLRLTLDGTWELKCRGEIEARVYAMGSAHGAYTRLGEITCPATVFCGEHTNAIPADFGRDFAERIPNGRFVLAEGLGHFGPLENPEWAAASIVESASEAEHQAQG